MLFKNFIFEILLSSSVVTFELKAAFVTVLCAFSVVSLSLAWQVDGHTGEVCNQACMELFTHLWTAVVGQGTTGTRGALPSSSRWGSEAVMAAAQWACDSVDRRRAVVSRTVLRSAGSFCFPSLVCAFILLLFSPKPEGLD